MTASEKLFAFIYKLPVWKRRIYNCNFFHLMVISQMGILMCGQLDLRSISFQLGFN